MILKRNSKYSVLRQLVGKICVLENDISPTEIHILHECFADNLKVAIHNGFDVAIIVTQILLTVYTDV